MDAFYDLYCKKRNFIVFLFFILSSSFTRAQDTSQVKDHIFPYIFTVSTIKEKLYPEINTAEELNNRLYSIDISIEEFFHADSLIVNESSFIKDSIYCSQFSINKKKYEAYCYFKPGLVTEDSAAFLIIPGSGDNQSSIIYEGIPNYQGDISNHTIKYGDTYVFVKPNEDFLAWYSDDYKLNPYGYVNYILNRGYSYSAYYISQAIAVVKELKSKYRKVVILGCSQGGSAALLIALQTDPSACVVASGYSILFDQLDWSSQSQIIIPGLSEHYFSQSIRSRIQNQEKTNYLFTYGLLEGDFYGLEAQYHVTENFFSGVKNAFFSADFFGHTYPQPKVEEFIIDVLRPKPILYVDNQEQQLTTNYFSGYTYEWYKNDTLIITEAINKYHAVEGDSVYVKVITASGIIGFSDTIRVAYQNLISSIIIVDTSTIVLPFLSSNSISSSEEANNIQNIDSISESHSTSIETTISGLPIDSHYAIFFQYDQIAIFLQDNLSEDLLMIQLISFDGKIILDKTIIKDSSPLETYLPANRLYSGIYIVRIIGKYHNLAVKLLKN